MKSTLLCHEHVWPFSIDDVNDSESSLIRFAIVSLPSGNAFYRHASCVPDILRQFFQCPALASQFHLCTWPRQLFLRDPVSTYCCTATGSRSPLPDVDFQRGGGDVRSGGFCPPRCLVALPHGSGKRRFSQPHRVSEYVLLLCSLRSCPLSAF